MTVVSNLLIHQLYSWKQILKMLSLHSLSNISQLVQLALKCMILNAIKYSVLCSPCNKDF